MKVKRFLLLVLALVMVVSTAACADKPGKTGASSESGAASELTPKEQLAGLIEQAEALTNEGVDPAVWTQFQAVLTEAKALTENTSAIDVDFADMILRLTEAFALLNVEPELPEVSAPADDAQSNAGSTASRSNASASSVKPGDVKTIAGLPPLSSKVTNKTVTMLASSEASEDDSTAKFEAGLLRDYGIKVQRKIVTYTAMTTQLITMIAAKNPPDLYPMINSDYPTTVNRKLFMALEKPFENFKDPIWTKKNDGGKSMLDEFNRWKWKGSIYFIGGSSGVSSFVWYNKRMFSEAALKDPLWHYDNNQWDWNSMLTLAKKLTKSKNNDGKIDQWGIGGQNLPYMFQGALGEDWVKVTSAGVVNNMRSERLAKAQNFLQDLMLTHKVTPQENSSEFSMMINNQLAMGYFGHWFTFTDDKTKARLKAGDFGFVPAPNAPGEKPAYYGFLSGTCIPNGAKNVDGAVAYFTYKAYYDTQLEETSKGQMSSWLVSQINAGWTDDMVRVYLKSNKETVHPMFAEGIGNALQWAYEPLPELVKGTSWSTIVEKYAPKMDAAIATMK